MTQCAYCDRDMKPTARGCGREITGWERVRVEGGANAIIARRETGRYVCAICLGAIRVGIDPRSQGTM